MNKDRFIVTVFSLLALFLVVSCGIDTYYILYAPNDAVLPANKDFLSREFNFKTNDAQNISMNIFLGTSVYYKIYDDESNCKAEKSTIDNSNTQYSDSGFKKLESLGYKQLGVSTNQEPLVPKDTYNRSVSIRLYTEGVIVPSTDPDFKKAYCWGIKVGGIDIKDGSELAIPLRSNGYTFDFFNNYHYKDPDKDYKKVTVNGKIYENAVPLKTDDDVKLTLDSTPTKYYVNAYAVSVGRESTFTMKYGELLALGYIIIEKDNH